MFILEGKTRKKVVETILWLNLPRIYMDIFKTRIRRMRTRIRRMRRTWLSSEFLGYTWLKGEQQISRKERYSQVLTVRSTWWLCVLVFGVNVHHYIDINLQSNLYQLKNNNNINNNKINK